MRTYQVIRDVDSRVRCLIHRGQRVHELSPAASLRLFNHSPTGFECGYGGSGPAQLALAILFDLTRDETMAIRFHQPFKFSFIAPMDKRGGSIEEDAALDWLEDVVKQQGSHSDLLFVRRIKDQTVYTGN